MSSVKIDAKESCQVFFLKTNLEILSVRTVACKKIDISDISRIKDFGYECILESKAKLNKDRRKRKLSGFFHRAEN